MVRKRKSKQSQEIVPTNANDLRTDLIREFNYERERCRDYFDYMYRTVQFTFVAIIAIAIAVSQYENSTTIMASITVPLLLSHATPDCAYLFGTMFMYNAYALAVYGRRAQILHHAIYADCKNSNISEIKPEVLEKYVMTNRFLAMLSYGVTLSFYLILPAASQFVSLTLCPIVSQHWFFRIIPWICMGIYWSISTILILFIAINHFKMKPTK